ncbi:glycosyltransferase [Thiocapsa bogorovii]|uniref:glycosyltransferase n=1 Tax=Thiocapsa bogorovii TaxID=521689 RepID=UPI001E475546|nr:glycosyltransferase [Thiocapsa bogorovii]UHD15868.1 glycosyltransferase family 4 protein [Thiocapsa bogorovii]
MADCWGQERFISLPYSQPRALIYRLRRRLLKLLDREAAFRRSVDGWYDNRLDARFRTIGLSLRPDVVIVEYVFFSKALRCFPGHALKVIDTHDLFSNRHRGFIDHFDGYGSYSITPREERKGLDRADVVLAIQDEEGECFRQMTNREIVTVGHLISVKRPAARTGGARLLFMGSVCKSNADAVAVLKDLILPRIRAEIPEAELILAGPIGEGADEQTDGVIALGRVESLAALYATVDIVVNPVRAGTGLKIKNIEALAYGKPVVTTALGAAGLKPGTGLVVANDPTAFASAVVAILRDPSRYASLSEGAYRFACEWTRRQRTALRSVLGHVPIENAGRSARLLESAFRGRPWMRRRTP